MKGNPSVLILRSSSEELIHSLKPFGVHGNILICDIVETEGQFLVIEVPLRKFPEKRGLVLVPQCDVVCIYSEKKAKKDTPIGFAQSARAALSDSEEAADKPSDHP